MDIFPDIRKNSFIFFPVDVPELFSDYVNYFITIDEWSCCEIKMKIYPDFKGYC